jgi:hypothetical protein
MPGFLLQKAFLKHFRKAFCLAEFQQQNKDKVKLNQKSEVDKIFLAGIFQKY